MRAIEIENDNGARFWGHPTEGIDVFAGMEHSGTDHSGWIVTDGVEFYPKELSKELEEWENPPNDEDYNDMFSLQQDALYDYMYSIGWCQGHFNPRYQFDSADGREQKVVNRHREIKLLHLFFRSEQQYRNRFHPGSVFDIRTPVGALLGQRMIIHQDNLGMVRHDC